MGDLVKPMKTCLPVLCFESVKHISHAKNLRQRQILPPARNTLAEYPRGLRNDPQNELGRVLGQKPSKSGIPWHEISKTDSAYSLVMIHKQYLIIFEKCLYEMVPMVDNQLAFSKK